MSDVVKIALIVSLAPTLIALGGIFKILSDLRRYHKEVNGKLSEFIEVSGDAREAMGHLRGVKDEKKNQE